MGNLEPLPSSGKAWDACLGRAFARELRAANSQASACRPLKMLVCRVVGSRCTRIRVGGARAPREVRLRVPYRRRELQKGSGSQGEASSSGDRGRIRACMMMVTVDMMACAEAEAMATSAPQPLLCCPCISAGMSPLWRFLRKSQWLASHQQATQQRSRSAMRPFASLGAWCAFGFWTRLCTASCTWESGSTAGARAAARRVAGSVVGEHLFVVDAWCRARCDALPQWLLAFQFTTFCGLMSLETCTSLETAGPHSLAHQWRGAEAAAAAGGQGTERGRGGSHPHSSGLITLPCLSLQLHLPLHQAPVQGLPAQQQH